MQPRHWRVVAGAAAVAMAVVLVAVLVCWDKVRDVPYGEQPYGANATVQWPAGQAVFTVLQIADTQIADPDSDVCMNVPPGEPCGAWRTTDFVRRLVASVRPDVVVFTGDQVSGPDRPEAALEAVWGPVREAGTPFVFVFGNHDVERCGAWGYGATRAHVERHALLTGTGVLRVATNGTAQARLWFLDYAYDSEEAAGTDVAPAHLAWFKERAAASGGGGADVVFLHVPPPEFGAWPIRTGVQQEPVAASAANSGLVAALPPGVRAVAVGHDHANDYCAGPPGGGGAGPALCYAGGAGYTTYGADNWPRRARVFQWHRNGSLSTHKRLDARPPRPLDFEWLAGP